LGNVRHSATTGENCGQLEIRRVHDWKSFLSQPEVLYVSDDSDDLPGPLFVDIVGLVSQQQALTDGVFIGKLAPGEGLADNGGPWHVSAIRLAQIAALPQRNP
jgi:hypothetical protein